MPDQMLAHEDLRIPEEKKVEDAGLHAELNSENEALFVSECQPRQPENGDRRKLF